MECRDIRDKIIKNTESHNSWRRNCINLIASENVMSPLAEKLYSSDLMHRYAEGLPYKRFYQGTKYIDTIEDTTFDLAKQVFGADFADPRPISGAIANMAVFSTIEQGSTIIAPSVTAGCHISHEKFGCAGIRGLITEHHEFDADKFEFVVDKSVEKIQSLKPKLITLGGSVIPFKQNIREINRAAHESGALVMYDAAHVLGLIAGGEFQHPFEEGADIITGSTHKTLPGPQGGIILAKGIDDKLVNKIQAKVFPGLVSNHHLHHVPALGVTLVEMLAFGKEYASHIVSNAQAFAKALDEIGFSVVHKERGGKKIFSESHQVLLDVRPQGKGKLVAESLEQANVITNKQMLWFDDVNNPADPSGLRLGVQEMTRFGMTEKDMGRVADFFRRVLVEKENPERVRNDVIAMRSEFQNVNYCFKE